MNVKGVVQLVTSLVQQLARDPQFFANSRLKYLGVFRGFVEDVVDPQKRGRVRVRVPHVNNDAPTALLPWAERSVPDAGPDCGLFVPLRAGVQTGDGHTGDAVWVCFEGGDPHKPVVIGLWHGAPGGRGEAPEESKGRLGHRRRMVWKSRHGTTIEVGDEQSDFEFKVTMRCGHILHMREADGGRGFHINTGGGHKISLQDEHPGQTGTPVLNSYDKIPDYRHEVVMPPDPPVPGVFAGQRREAVATDGPKAADGVVKTASGPAAEGFGQKGVCIETSGGHSIHLRDVTNPGALVRTADGHEIELLDDPNEIHMRTAGGQRVSLYDAAQRIQMVAGLTVDITAGATVNINAGAVINLGAPFIGIDANNSYVHADGSGIVVHTESALTMEAPSVDINEV